MNIVTSQRPPQPQQHKNQIVVGLRLSDRWKHKSPTIAGTQTTDRAETEQNSENRNYQSI